MNINYPSGKQRKALKECEIAHVIKYLALGLNKTAFNTAMKNKELSCLLIELVFKLIDDECEALCRKDSESILRCSTPAALVELKLRDLKNEFSLKAPLLTKLLSQLCTSKRTKVSPNNKSEVRVDELIVPTVASVVLRARCPEMSALAYRLGLILRHSGAGTLVGSHYLAYRYTYLCIY